jgi:hypothetical protein
MMLCWACELVKRCEISHHCGELVAIFCRLSSSMTSRYPGEELYDLKRTQSIMFVCTEKNRHR